MKPSKKRQTIVFKRAPRISNSPRSLKVRLAFAKKAHAHSGETGLIDGLNKAAHAIKTEGLDPEDYTQADKDATKTEQEAKRVARVALTTRKIAGGVNAFRV